MRSKLKLRRAGAGYDTTTNAAVVLADEETPAVDVAAVLGWNSRCS